MREITIKSQSGKNIEFTSGSGGHETSLVILSFGEDFSGKSSLGATGPGISAIVPLDRKTRFAAEKRAKECGGSIIMPKVDLVREGNMSVRSGWMSEDTEVDEKKAGEIDKKTKIAYRSHINMVKETVWALHDHKDVRLIQIDLFEQFWQDLCFAHYGRTGNLIRKLPQGKVYKDTSEAHQEMVDFINSISDKHLILTHRCRDEYYNDVKTGRMTWNGNKYLGHLCNVVIEHIKNRKYDPNSKDDNKSWHYGLNIHRCLHNIELEGPDGQLVLTDDLITFQFLAKAVFPTSDMKEWE